MAGRGWIKSDDQLHLFAEKLDEILNKGVYFNLMQQLNCTARHSKGGLAIGSQRQYYHHLDLFIRHLSDHYGTQNLANISGQHMSDYLLDRQAEGMAASTVTSDLCAIRYFHDQMGPNNTRHRLPNNTQLQQKYNISLDVRTYGKVNRRWSRIEVQRMIELAQRMGKYNIVQMIHLAAELGLRIHEGVRLCHFNLKNALQTGVLHIKGKNGLERDVPLRSNINDILSQLVNKNVNGDSKVFVPPGKQAHQVIQSVQSFIYNHRDKVAESGVRSENVPMCFHGLRHLFAYERYNEFVDKGFTESAARLKVSHLLGHSREEITNIYLGK